VPPRDQPLPPQIERVVLTRKLREVRVQLGFHAQRGRLARPREGQDARPPHGDADEIAPSLYEAAVESRRRPPEDAPIDGGTQDDTLRDPLARNVHGLSALDLAEARSPQNLQALRKRLGPPN
jgi:hypothetical protein